MKFVELLDIHNVFVLIKGRNKRVDLNPQKLSASTTE